MNNLFQRRKMQGQQLMQQGQRMLAQQQADEQKMWQDIGQSIGGAVFPNMANGAKDGQYNGQDLSQMEGYDKSLSDKENFARMYGNPDISGAGNAFINNNTGEYANMFVANNPQFANSNSPQSYVLGGSNSLLSQGANAIGPNSTNGNNFNFADDYNIYDKIKQQYGNFSGRRFL